MAHMTWQTYVKSRRVRKNFYGYLFPCLIVKTLHSGEKNYYYNFHLFSTRKINKLDENSI